MHRGHTFSFSFQRTWLFSTNCDAESLPKATFLSEKKYHPYHQDLNEQTMVHKFFKPLKNERPCPPISQKAFCPLLNLQSDPSPTSNSKNVKKEDSFCLPVCHFGNLIQLTLNFYFRLLSGSQASQKGGCRVKDPLQKKKVLSLQAKQYRQPRM